MVTRILLVEDNPQNMKLASVILRKAGYEVIAAADSDEAESSIEAQVPDLILMDLGLPGKDGYTLTRELKRRPRTASVPILAVTSYAMKGDEAKARDAGCSGYLAKPIDRLELLRTVRSLVETDGDGGGP
ncbi:MAG: response regulator [Thermoplasmata archaeon]|nr:response regulator [Thermoplasmata archaeon]